MPCFVRPAVQILMPITFLLIDWSFYLDNMWTKAIKTENLHTSVNGVQQILYYFFQSHQVDELIVGCRGQEVKLWGRGLGWGDLQEGLLQLLPQSEFSCSLAAGWRVVHAGHRHAAASGGRALQTGWRALWQQAKTGRNKTAVNVQSRSEYLGFVWAIQVTCWLTARCLLINHVSDSLSPIQSFCNLKN